MDADGSRKMKNVQLNLEKKKLKPTSFINVGTKAKTITGDFGNESDKKKFYSSCKKFYIAAVSYLQNNLPFNIAAVSYLQNNLPFNNKLIEFSQCVHTQKINSSAFTSVISNLCLKIVKLFGSKPPKVFELPLDSSSDSILGVVRHQWKMYQLENITQSMYISENEERNNNISSSYWN